MLMLCYAIEHAMMGGRAARGTSVKFLVVVVEVQVGAGRCSAVVGTISVDVLVVGKAKRRKGETKDQETSANGDGLAWVVLCCGAAGGRVRPKKASSGRRLTANESVESWAVFFFLFFFSTSCTASSGGREKGRAVVSVWDEACDDGEERKADNHRVQKGEQSDSVGMAISGGGGGDDDDDDDANDDGRPSIQTGNSWKSAPEMIYFLTVGIPL